MNNGKKISYHRTLLPDPATSTGVSGVDTGEEGDIRLPWIHKREGDDFHSLKIPPSKNQEAVPLW
jgi:hypothetical protein